MLLAAVSNIAQEVDRAFYIIGGICIVLLIAITLVMVWFAIRYRRKVTPTAAQFHGNLPLEITWMIIPLVVVIYMFFVGYEGFSMMRNPPADAKIIKVTGQQWFWTFDYPEEGISSDILCLPVNQAIKLELNAPVNDVLHSFFLPAFRVKEDVVPGQATYLWIQPEKIGVYNIFCAEFCGKEHASMISILEVKSQEDYLAWVDQKIADKFKPVNINEAINPQDKEFQTRDGKKIYETYCVACHGKKGLGGLVEGSRDFTSMAGWTRSPKITDMYRTLTEGVEGTQMRGYKHLPAWDRFALAHYVADFYKGPDRPKATEEEIKQLNDEYQLDKIQPPKKRIPIEKAMEIIIQEKPTRSQGQ